MGDGSVHSWARSASLSADLAVLVGQVPARWGRMTPLSRLVIVETGRLLRAHGLLEQGTRCSDKGRTIGLIGATRRGSLYTDQAFIVTMAEGAGLASPALFGYTLANIPLAEAASQYGLIGPVYALFDEDNPLLSAEREAKRLLSQHQKISAMLACEFDHYSLPDGKEIFNVSLTVARKP